MADKNNTPQEAAAGSKEQSIAQPEKEEKPDLNLAPPAYQWLTEGYDPDRPNTRGKN